MQYSKCSILKKLLHFKTSYRWISFVLVNRWHSEAKELLIIQIWIDNNKYLWKYKLYSTYSYCLSRPFCLRFWRKFQQFLRKNVTKKFIYWLLQKFSQHKAFINDFNKKEVTNKHTARLNFQLIITNDLISTEIKSF